MIRGEVSDSARRFTWKELSHMNGKSNLHVAYNGKVYDVSSFVARHPGGAEQILAGAGRDITQVFKSYHKSDTFEKVLSNYYVGELLDNELPVFPKESEFLTTIKTRVENYLQMQKMDPKIDYGMFLHYAFIVSLYFSSMFISLKYYNIPVIAFFATAIWATATTNISHTLYHDASHCTITHKPSVWKVLSIIAAFFTGVSSLTWKYSHIFGHHVYTNVDGADPDIDTGKKSSKAVWRIKKSQSWQRKFVLQYLYMPFLYCILFIKMRLQDFRFVFTLSKDCIRMNPLSFVQWIQFLTEKLGHAIIRYIIPSAVVPFPNVILMNIVFEIISSFTLAQISLLNHVTDEVEWPLPDDKNKVNKDWAELQVMSTYDYCTDKIFVTLCTGSMNHQIAHHLFPGYLQSHYRWITPIIRKTCAEFGVQYNYKESVLDMLKLHYYYLKYMGNGEDEKKAKKVK